jgi:FkbM family methyltransferase
MQYLRTTIRIIVFYLLNQIIKLPFGLTIFNWIYEHSNPMWVHVLNTHIKLPNKNAIWKIYLNNGEIIKTRLIKDKPIMRHVAMGYRWHDSSINRIETVIVDYFASISKEKSYYIDAGSNMGMRSMCALSKRLNVIMIEPNEETNEINMNRCRLNNFSNYELLDVGLSNEDTSKKIYFDSSSYLSTLDPKVANQEDINITKELVIKVNRLDTLLSNRLKKENRFFIKMDIEGHEIEALEGCKELLAEPNVTFLVEINEKGKHIETIFKKMKELGYKIYEKIPVTPGDQFLRERFIDGSNLAFVSDDFLFIKSSEVVRLFERHIQEKSL